MHDFIARFRGAYLADFSLAFLGFGIFRFWYQYNLYNLHATTDYGVGVAWVNVVRGVVCLALTALMFGRDPSLRVRSALVWGSFALMTVSAGFNMLEIATGTLSYEIARYATCGLGLVWGYCMWMDVYRRMEPRQAFLCLVGGLALSCVLSLFAGYLGKATMGLVNLFVPVLVVLAYGQSMRVLDERGCPMFLKADCRGMSGRLSARGRSDYVQLGAAFFVFALVLGITLGFPDGEPRSLAQLPRTVHQAGVALMLLWLLWWVLVRGRAFTFPVVWYFENALLIVAIVLLAEEGPFARTLATALFLSAESFFYTFVFFTSHAVGRHVSWSSTAVFALLYGGSLLCMGTGRLLSVAMSRLPGGEVAMLLVMSVLVVTEMVLALRVYHPGGTTLFDDVAPIHPLTSGGHGPEEADNVSAPDAGSASTVPSWDVASETGRLLGSADDEIRARLDALRERFDLTGNETRIAELLVREHSRAQIADALGYSENTIRNYTHALYVKLGIHRRSELVDVLSDMVDEK